MLLSDEEMNFLIIEGKTIVIKRGQQQIKKMKKISTPPCVRNPILTSKSE